MSCVIIIVIVLQTKFYIIAMTEFCRVYKIEFEIGDIHGRGKKNACTPGEKLVVRLRRRWHDDDDDYNDDDDEDEDNDKLGSEGISYCVQIFSE